jgi:16S rRNA (guanine1207-N2)-methyltransferase
MSESLGYYDLRRIPVLLRGEPATLVGKLGVWNWDDVNPGTAALIDMMEVDTDDQVVDLGCGTGLIGLAAARLATRGQVRLVDVNVGAVACARRTLEVNGVTDAVALLADGLSAVETYDLVLCHLPRGRAVIESLIRDVARALKPGGRFYLVAHKRAGVKSAIRYAAEILGRAGVVRQRKGYHVALASKDQLPPRYKADEYRRFEILLEDSPVVLVSKPGVFAWDRLDAGTAALVQTMEIRAGETVLDLGCGTGLLALVAARRGGRVTGVDADLRAVESARRTLAENDVSGQVLISDCAQSVLDRRFDVVLCNPPFHQGVGVEYEVARQMVRDAATVLRPGGRLYLVSNVFLRYEEDLRERFSRVKEVLNDRRYRVLQAVR